MALKKQMELFEEGGLMQEGGMTDPVSGNDVPVGSTKEEVRDDIPAQLSEGEFVMPADVVRYHGLDKMMALRDEAKAGLQRMEDMGQMGNSEEATIPEGIPFDINDLDMEDDEENNFAVGGYVAPQIPGLTQQQSAFSQYTPQYTPYTAPTVPTALPTSYTAPTQQDVPMAPTMGALPTFEQVVPPSTGDVRKYVNEQGLELMIPFVNGQPVYPIPAGYKPFEEKAETPTTPTAPTTAPTAQTEMGGDDSGMTPAELAEQRQNFADIASRKEAAKTLGYKNEIGTIEFLAGALIPGVSMMNKYDAGDIMPDGTIADGSGNTFDPITGERKSVSGGILGNMMNDIAGAFGGGTKAEDAKISPAAKAMGLSPASMAGLMTIAGNQSINQAIGKPTLAGGMGTAPTATTGTIGGLTSEQIDEAVKAGLGTREEIEANLKAAETSQVETTLGKTAVSEAAKAAQPATVSGAAQMSLQDKLDRMSKAGLTADTLRDSAQISEDSITPFARDVLNEVRNSGVTMDTAFSRVVERYDVDDMGFPVSKPSTDELTFRDIESRQAKSQNLTKTADLVRAAVETSRRTPAQQTQDLVSAAARASTRDRSQPSLQDQITAEATTKGYNKDYESAIKAGDYDAAFAARDAFSRDVAAEIARSEKAEIASAKSEGRSPNVGTRAAGFGEVSDSQGNVVRSSDGSAVTSPNSPTSSAKGLAIAAEREQRNADNATDSRVICTELYKQGKLSRDLYRMDVLYTARDLPATLVRGYHYWAIPMVPVIRRNKFVCSVFEYLTVKRAEEIAHIVDPIKHTKTTIAGKIIKNVGEAICYAIGIFVKQKDYTVLYNEKSV